MRDKCQTNRFPEKSMPQNGEPSYSLTDHGAPTGGRHATPHTNCTHEQTLPSPLWLDFLLDWWWNCLDYLSRSVWPTTHPQSQQLPEMLLILVTHGVLTNKAACPCRSTWARLAWMAWLPLSLTVFFLSWPSWHSSSCVTCSNSLWRQSSLPTERLRFGAAFCLDSHPHHCSPGLLDLSDLPPASLSTPHHHQSASPNASRVLVDCLQEQTPFFPRIFKVFPLWPQSAAPLPGCLLKLPQKLQPHSRLMPWAMLCLECSSFFLCPHRQPFFLTNTYLWVPDQMHPLCNSLLLHQAKTLPPFKIIHTYLVLKYY